MIKIREILKDFRKPVFAIRGNHEKEEVLRGLEQTVPNFHYSKNTLKNFKETSVYFMDTHYGLGYGAKTVEGDLQKAISQLTGIKGIKILLCHESFPPFEDALPKDMITKAKEAFDWVVNGHMHTWNVKACGLSNVITLPSLLPSRVVLGKYWSERYRWESKDKKPKLVRRESPFGYTTLDTSTGQIEFCRFEPSQKTIEVSVEMTDLTLSEARERFRAIYDSISLREDKEKLIVLPRIYGGISFSPVYLKDVAQDYDFYIDSIKYKKGELLLRTLTTVSGKVVSVPVLDPEELAEEIRKAFPQLLEELNKKLPFKVNEKDLTDIVSGLLRPEIIENPPLRLAARIQLLLSEVIDVLERGRKIERPQNFQDILSVLARKVKA